MSGLFLGGFFVNEVNAEGVFKSVGSCNSGRTYLRDHSVPESGQTGELNDHSDRQAIEKP